MGNIIIAELYFNKRLNKDVNMKKFLLLIVCLLIASCTSSRNESNHWDFDHNLKFDQKQLDDKVYQVVIHRKKDTQFPQLAAFLMRHALDLCQNYGYKLEIIEGVEGFNDKIVAKSYIQPSLKAKVECAKK
jgi:hypothetical protein